MNGTSPWAPFRSRVFAVMWVALLIGNIGTWMRDVGSGWLMTSLSASALAVSLVQVATTLPIFLLSLPAGALADIVDRRRLMLGLSLAGGFLLAALALVTQLGLVTPVLLIALLAAAGVVTAVMTPVLQSLTPRMVAPHQLREAVALNSMGFNVARALGPAIGGALVVAAGAAWTFWIDALTYLALIAAFWWWKGAAAPAAEGRPERLAPALRVGVRFAWNAPPFKRVLLRAGLFFAFASAYWALLPLVARRHLAGDAAYYGVLLGSVGAGAVVGALLLPAARRWLSGHALMQAGALLTIAVLLVLALWPQRLAAVVALGVAGAAWIAVLTTANVAAQTQLPGWVRGRGMAIYLTVFYGAMTFGSLVWGSVADAKGIAAALCMAAGLGVATVLVSQRLPLLHAEPDLAPSHHWPDPVVALGEAELAQRGPVMVTVRYRIDAARRADFLSAMNALGAARRRDGAWDWGVYESIDAPGNWTEVFFVSGWDEHERQHHRVTRADQALQDEIRAMHQGPGAPVVGHAVAP